MATVLPCASTQVAAGWDQKNTLLTSCTRNTGQSSVWLLSAVKRGRSWAIHHFLTPRYHQIFWLHQKLLPSWSKRLQKTINLVSTEPWREGSCSEASDGEDQVGQGFEKPDQVKSVPDHGKGAALDDLQRFTPRQTILPFYDFQSLSKPWSSS